MTAIIDSAPVSPMSVAKTPVETPATVDSLDLGSPEGFEVFVGRMPLKTSEEQLMQLAAPFNPTAGRVRPKRRYPYLCGFVVFNLLTEAEGFIAANHGKAAFGGPNPLNVRFSDGKNASKKIFVGGLAVSTDFDELKRITSAYGTVLAANILGRKNRAPCGFVTFATAKQAQACIAGLHDTPNADRTKKYVVKIGDGGSAESTKKRVAKPAHRDDDDNASVKRRRRDCDNSESSTATSTPRQEFQHGFMQQGLTAFNLNHHDNMQQNFHNTHNWGQQQQQPMNLLSNGGQILNSLNSGLFVNQQQNLNQATTSFVDQNGHPVPVFDQSQFINMHQGPVYEQQPAYEQQQPVQNVHFVDQTSYVQMPIDNSSMMMQPIMLQPMMMPLDHSQQHMQQSGLSHQGSGLSHQNSADYSTMQTTGMHMVPVSYQ